MKFSRKERKGRKERKPKMNRKTMVFVCAAMVALTGCVGVPKVDNAPVAALDLSRYLGEWYEIARFDHSFERGYDTDKLIWVRQDK